MNYLLDTHVALWFIQGNEALSDKGRSLLSAPGVVAYFSPASIQEIGIKHQIKPDLMPISGTDARAMFLEAGFKELPIMSIHAACIDTLPLLHRDPFDRMLVSQAKVSGYTLLSHDDFVAAYGNDIVLHV